MSIADLILAWLAQHPGSTAAQIAAGVSEIPNGDAAAKHLYALHKDGSVARGTDKPFRYTLNDPAQPVVAAVTPAASAGNSTHEQPKSSAPRAGRAPARAKQPAAAGRVTDRIESWCVWHDGEVHLLCPDGNTWVLGAEQALAIGQIVERL